jgi:hypothetical protein
MLNNVYEEHNLLSICLKLELGTVLQPRMYLAVSAGLNRVVSVRNTMITHDGCYPLRFPAPVLNIIFCYVCNGICTSIESKINYLKLELGNCSDFPHPASVYKN